MIKLAMEKVVRVRDVMSRDVIAIELGTSAEEAAQRLLDNRISGAPVTTSSGKLVGVVSRGDLLDPRHRHAAAVVDDAMTRVIYAVRPNDPVMVAVKLMVDENIHRAVVVDERGRLNGIVTPMDVLRVLLRDNSEEGAIAIEYVNLERT